MSKTEKILVSIAIILIIAFVVTVAVNEIIYELEIQRL